MAHYKYRDSNSAISLQLRRNLIPDYNNTVYQVSCSRAVAAAHVRDLALISDYDMMESNENISCQVIFNGSFIIISPSSS